MGDNGDNEKESDIGRQEQNAQMKTIYHILQLHTVPARLELLSKMLLKLKEKNNDYAISILTSILYKSEFKDPSTEDMPKLLSHAKDFWLPKTLDVLGENAPFILEIQDSLQSSLGLYITCIVLERKMEAADHLISSPQTRADFSTRFFDPLVNTIEAGFTSLKEQAEQQPSAKDAFDMKSSQLQMLQD
jgi:hypothetical protein